MTIDLTDVSKQVRGFYNSAITTGYACAQVAYKCLTSPTDYPINDANSPINGRDPDEIIEVRQLTPWSLDLKVDGELTVRGLGIERDGAIEHPLQQLAEGGEDGADEADRGTRVGAHRQAREALDRVEGHRAAAAGDLVGLAGPVVGDAERVFGHGVERHFTRERLDSTKKSRPLFKVAEPLSRPVYPLTARVFGNSGGHHEQPRSGR